MARNKPNILITGTPGTGKSTLAAELANKLNFTHLNIGQIVTENDFNSEFDEQYQCGVLDEEKLLDHIEVGIGLWKQWAVTNAKPKLQYPVTNAKHKLQYPVIKFGVLDEEKLLDHIEDQLNSTSGGFIVDYHGCDFFPERWFDAVFVLRTNNTALYDRLTPRGYNQKKLTDNIECEIFGVLAEEAKEAYKEEIVHEIQSDNTDDLENNIERIVEWVGNWNC